MNLRLIEHRKYNFIDNNCIVQILHNGGWYPKLQDCKDFGLPVKYKNMENIKIQIGTNCIVVDNLYHQNFKCPTILVCMENLNDNKYTLIINNPVYIKLIKGKIPEPHK